MKIYEVLIPNGDDEPIRKNVMAKTLEIAKTNIVEYMAINSISVDINDVIFNEGELI